MKYFYIKTDEIEVNIGDVIKIDGVKVPFTKELINLYPDMFKVVDNETSSNEKTIGQCDYVGCLNIKNEDYPNVHISACYTTQYLINHVNISEDTPLESNIGKFEKINKNDYYQYLCDVVNAKIPSLKNYFITLLDDNNLYAEFYNKDSYHYILIYSGNENKWYQNNINNFKYTYTNEDGELIRYSDECYYFYKDTPYKINNAVFGVLYDNKLSFDKFYVTKHKNIAELKYYEYYREYVIRLVWDEKSNKDANIYNMLNFLSKTLHITSRNADLFDNLLKTNNNNKSNNYVVLKGGKYKLTKNPSCTDVVFKSPIIVKEAIKIMGDLIY